MNPEEIKQKTMTMRSGSTKSRSCWIGQKVRYTRRLSSWDCVSEVRFPPAGEMALSKKVCACVRAASVIQVPVPAAVDRK